MQVGTSVMLGVGLSMDASAVALGLGATRGKHVHRQLWRVALAFGLFQAGMPLIAYLGGSAVAPRVSAAGPWIAFALLAGVGLKMLHSAVQPIRSAVVGVRGWAILALAFATSLDALACGFALPFMGIEPLPAAGVFGIVTFAMSYLAGYLGVRLGDRFGRAVEVAGAVLLIGISIHVLFVSAL